MVGLGGRLWFSGLYRNYPYFFGYLTLALLQTAVLAPIPLYSMAYRNGWVITESLMLIAQILVVLELCKVILGGLGGITSVARHYTKWTLALAIAASMLLLTIEHAPFSLMSYFLTTERAIMSTLVLFFLLMMMFLLYYPVPLNRNAIVYSIGYAVYFLAKAAAIFVRNLDPQWGRAISTLLLGVSTACILFWLFALSRRGETRAMVAGHKWSSQEEERLLSQLRSINSSLGRVSPTLQRRVALPDKAD